MILQNINSSPSLFSDPFPAKVQFVLYTFILGSHPFPFLSFAQIKENETPIYQNAFLNPLCCCSLRPPFCAGFPNSGSQEMCWSQCQQGHHCLNQGIRGLRTKTQTRSNWTTHCRVWPSLQDQGMQRGQIPVEQENRNSFVEKGPQGAYCCPFPNKCCPAPL